MTSLHSVGCLLLAGLIVGCQPTSDSVPNADERNAIADTVSQLFDEIAEATNALEFDRLLGNYRASDDLTYVARGQVTRSHESFADLVDAQFRGVTEADLRWIDTHIDVLTSTVAVATTTYEFTAVLETGDTVQSAGTFMCIYVARDGEWKVDYSAHSFPLAR